MGADTHPVACSRHCQHFRQHNHLRTIAAVGDSITYGTCASDRAIKSWPAQLQRGYLWQDPTVRVLNFGASGRTMTRSGDNPYWDDAEFDRAKASKADAFVIGLGTNDAKHYNWDREAFEQDYRDMVAVFPGPERRGLSCRAAASLRRRRLRHERDGHQSYLSFT